MNNPKNILITGASGLIGSRLTELFQQKGYEVSHLGRAKKSGGVKSFTWDINQHEIEAGAFEGIDAIIHLAGAGVADKPWTSKRKEEILLSRTKSTRLLYDELRKGNHQVKTFVSASGINYYGVADTGKAFTEDDKPADDFLADVTRQWEAEADRLSELMRVCKLRTGVVLSNKGGALPKLAAPIRWLVGAPLGSGNQYVNWIHIDDLCSLFIRMIEDDSLSGAYNAVAPTPVTNRQFTYDVAHTLKKPLILPPIPSFALKMLLGNMAYIVLEGGKISAAKVLQTKFNFKFTELPVALQDLLK